MTGKFERHKNTYSLILLGGSILSLILLSFLSAWTGYISKSYASQFAFMLRIVFLTAFILIGLREFFRNNNTILSLFSTRSFLIFGLVFSLILSLFSAQVNAIGIAVYLFSVLLYFLRHRLFFSLNKIYWLLFAFALLQLFGTISTAQGFHFPEKTYSFYILPLSYCFFSFEKASMLRILKLSFRLLFLYSCVSIIYWWFNALSYDVPAWVWLGNKLSFEGQGAYVYVADWANFFYKRVEFNASHPTYVSFVLLCGLTIGFYLHYKKAAFAYISTFELLAFTISCGVLILALESRLGILAFSILTVINLLYYVKLKLSKFKTVLFLSSMLGILLMFSVESKLRGFVADKARTELYTLSMSHIKEHPWWGCGTNQQKEALIQQKEKLNFESSHLNWDDFLYVHNQFFGEVLQFGIWGGILLLIVFGGLLYYSLKTRNYLLQMFLLIYFMGMMIEEPLYMPEGIMRFCVYLSFFIAVGDSERIRPSRNINDSFKKKKIRPSDAT